MTPRLLAMGALCAVGFLCASSGQTVAQGIVLNLPWAKGDQINRDPGKGTNARRTGTTTVKSSKSNTSDRMGGGGGAKAGGTQY